MQDKWQEKIYLICVWASGITTCHQIAQFPIWKFITCNLSIKPQITNSRQTSKVGLKLQCFGFGSKCADHWATLLPFPFKYKFLRRHLLDILDFLDIICFSFGLFLMCLLWRLCICKQIIGICAFEENWLMWGWDTVGGPKKLCNR